MKIPIYTIASVIKPFIINTKIKSYNNNNIKILNIIASSIIKSVIYSKFNNLLLFSKPTFYHNNNIVTINIFYYDSNKEQNNNYNITNLILIVSNILSSLYKKKVSINITRIYYPYLNSTIFAKYLGNNANTNNFLHFKNSIIENCNINISQLPFYISGIRIQLSGRLVTEKIIPRKTTKIIILGSFNNIIDYDKYTIKNQIGSFTIKVWIAQKII